MNTPTTLLSAGNTLNSQSRPPETGRDGVNGSFALPMLQRIGETQDTGGHALYDLVKQLSPSVFSILVCCIFVVVKPIAFLSGEADYAFLILVAYSLFFHAGGHTVGRHIQSTIIGVAGAVCGLGISAVAIELGCIANRIEGSNDSVGGRTAPAVFLAAVAFLAGDLKSRLPRLTSGCLVGTFVSIWCLATSVTQQHISTSPFLGLLYAVLFAAGISICAVMAIFPVTANAILAKQLTDTLGTTAELLLASLHLFQAENSLAGDADTVVPSLRERASLLRHRLAIQANALKPAFKEAKYEVTFSKLPIARYAPMIDGALRIQNTLTSRMGLDTSQGGSDIRCDKVAPQIRQAVSDLGKDNLQALESIRTLLSRPRRKGALQHILLGKNLASASIEKIQQHLDEDLSLLKYATVEALETALSEGGGDQGLGGHAALFGPGAFKDCLFYVSLVELTHDISQLLQQVCELTSSEKRRRIWLPAIGWKFFESSSIVAGDDGRVVHLEDSDHLDRREEDIRMVERVRHHADRVPSIQLQRPRQRLLQRLVSPSYHAILILESKERILDWWDSAAVRSKRLRLHSFLMSIRHSRHLKHGIKCSLGISLLTLPGHLPATDTGHRWFAGARGPWIAISFLYCFQTTTAATYRVAVFRTIGTLLGALYALVGQKIAQRNPYGLVAVATLQALVTDYWIIVKPRYQNLGTVAQLTVAPILFVPYLDLPYPGTVKLAFIRAYDIELGILAALLISITIWPYHARVKFVSSCAKAMDKITKMYLSMSRANMRRDFNSTTSTRTQYEHLEGEIRDLLVHSSSLCALVHLETSLLPKPIRSYTHLVGELNDLVNLFAGLRQIRQHIPRQLTVMDVLPQRTEFVSSILLTLHAISHSLHTRSAIPQFLPQPRVFLEHLVTAIETHIEGTYSTHVTPMTSPRATRYNSDARDSDRPVSAEPIGSHREFAGTSEGTTAVRSSVAFPTLAKSSSEAGHRVDFSFIYALAEIEAISEAVETIEEILDICRDLYGVATFIQAEEAGRFDLSIAPTPARCVRQSLQSPGLVVDRGLPLPR